MMLNSFFISVEPNNNQHQVKWLYNKKTCCINKTIHSDGGASFLRSKKNWLSLKPASDSLLKFCIRFLFYTYFQIFKLLFKYCWFWTHYQLFENHYGFVLNDAGVIKFNDVSIHFKWIIYLRKWRKKYEL